MQTIKPARIFFPFLFGIYPILALVAHNASLVSPMVAWRIILAMLSLSASQNIGYLPGANSHFQSFFHLIRLTLEIFGVV